MQFISNTSLFVLSLLFFVTAGTLDQRTVMPVLELTKQDTAINVNNDLLIFMSAGNKRLLTDLLWVQTLIEGDLDHYSKKDLNGWMYLRFKTIAAMDPLFYANYNWGGRYLSIVKDDLLGALDIYKSGLKFYRDDYNLNYGAGFTYYFELSDTKNGLPYFEKIRNYEKAPPFFSSLVAKMRLEQGVTLDSLLPFIDDMIKNTNDEVLIKKLKRDYYAVKAERDLTCLNRRGLNCDLLDSKGEKYVLQDGAYYSKTFFMPYRLKKKGDSKRTVLVNTFK